jgi:hypothetical protein
MCSRQLCCCFVILLLLLPCGSHFIHTSSPLGFQDAVILWLRTHMSRSSVNHPFFWTCFQNHKKNQSINLKIRPINHFFYNAHFVFLKNKAMLTGFVENRKTNRFPTVLNPCFWDYRSHCSSFISICSIYLTLLCGLRYYMPIFKIVI